MVFPGHDVSLGEVDANELSIQTQKELLDIRFIGLSVQQWLSIVLQLPPLHALVGNAEVLSGFTFLDDDLSKFFLVVGKGAHLLGSFLGKNVDLV